MDLFEIKGDKTRSLTVEDIRLAKRQLAKMHPDKSNTPPDVFIFFHQAFEQLQALQKEEDRYNPAARLHVLANQDDRFALTQDKTEMLNRRIQALPTDGHFNEFFNAEFQTHRLVDPMQHGYEDWLKSEEDLFGETLSPSERAALLDEKRRNLRQLAVVEHAQPSALMCVSSFGGNELTAFDSSSVRDFGSTALFQNNNSLGFTDLRKAYTNNISLYSKEEAEQLALQREQAVGGIEQYKSERAAPIELNKRNHDLRILEERRRREQEESNKAKEKLAKLDELAEQKSASFWAKLLTLKNL